MHGCAAHGRSLLKARSPPRLSIVSIIPQFASKAHETHLDGSSFLNLMTLGHASFLFGELLDFLLFNEL